MGSKNLDMLAAVLLFAPLAAGGCGRPSMGNARPAYVDVIAQSPSSRLELHAELCGTGGVAPHLCDITLTNLGSTAVVVPANDIAPHLGVFVYLSDSGGKEVELTRLGTDQFLNFRGLYVGGRRIEPGGKLSWQVDLATSFVVKPGRDYIVHISYSCNDTAEWPDIELAGLPFEYSKAVR